MTGHSCLNCGKPITWRFAICTTCEESFGNKPAMWPPWLRWLWNDEQRFRRRDRQTKKHEVLFTDMEGEDEGENE